MAASKTTQPIQGAPAAAQHSTLDGLAAILLGLPACSQKVDSSMATACVRPCNELSRCSASCLSVFAVCSLRRTIIDQQQRRRHHHPPLTTTTTRTTIPLFPLISTTSLAGCRSST